MKYRIYEKHGNFKIQRKRLLIWKWLDVCQEWDYWYGKFYPKLFWSLKSALDFIKYDESKWVKITSENIDTYLGE